MVAERVEGVGSGPGDRQLGDRDVRRGRERIEYEDLGAIRGGRVAAREVPAVRGDGDLLVVVLRGRGDVVVMWR